jgi:transcriptional regulator with XRE-family HTH domain
MIEQGGAFMHISLGERVQLLRQRRELTQQKLADQAGVSKMTIIRIEKGTVTNVQLQTLRAIAKVLGVAVDALLAESETPTPKRARATAKTMKA